MVFPFKNPSDCRITCIYGIKGTLWASGKHDGVDLISTNDKTILAISDGKVIRSSNTGAWGEHVVIQMADGRSVVYAHMIAGSRKVAAGATVKAGQPLGIMGNTGNSEGAHLHIEIQKSYYKAGAVDDIAKFLGIRNVKGNVALIESEVDDEVVTKTKIELNGKTVEVDTILKDGHNYIQLRDLSDILNIGYDAVKKMPIVTTK